MTFEDLKGQVIESIEVRGVNKIIFSIAGKRYKMYHSQNCCETVSIESIVGDLDDIIGQEILVANEASNEGQKVGDYETSSYTWTFYTLSTIKGSITIRWYGSSNGYYSEKVDFEPL